MNRKIERKDPDPVSAVLAILGAVGSIASVVSVFDQRRSEHATHQRQARDDLAQIVGHLATAEASLAELAAVGVRLVALAKTSSHREYPPLLPSADEVGPAFGRHGLYLDKKDLGAFFGLQDEAFRQGRLLQKELSSAFQVIYRSEVSVSDEQYQRLIRVVRKVNSLLRRFDSIEELLLGTVALCDEAGETIHELRRLLATAGGLS
jgi:hypothetical protein